MAITYTLYCKECYTRLKQEALESPAKTKPHKSYFICSGCGFETDRGYAVQASTSTDSRKEKHVINI